MNISDIEETIETVILFAAPIACIVSLVMDFSWTNVILVSIALLLWKKINNAVK